MPRKSGGLATADRTAASTNGAVAPKKGTKQVWKNEEGQWHWRLLSGNGQVVATAHEGYSRRGHAIKMMEQVLSGAYAMAPVAED